MTNMDRSWIGNQIQSDKISLTPTTRKSRYNIGVLTSVGKATDVKDFFKIEIIFSDVKAYFGHRLIK